MYQNKISNITISPVIIGIVSLIMVFCFGLSKINADDKIEIQCQEIKTLKLEIYELKQACELAEVLRQILPPVTWDELALQAEKLKQEKHP